jgi:hypothetical protein
MTGSKPDGLFEALPETRLPEPGDAENQVEGHVPESRLLRTPKGLFGLGRRMTPVHQAKGPVVERLHPDAQAVDLRAGEGLEVGSVEVVGIGLHGALLDRGTVEQRGGMIHELLQPCGGQQRRRAASEIDCPHMPIRKEGCGGLQLAVHRFDERVASPQLDAVEKVAVGAETFAERDMEIEAGHRSFRSVSKVRIPRRKRSAGAGNFSTPSPGTHPRSPTVPETGRRTATQHRPRPGLCTRKHRAGD